MKKHLLYLFVTMAFVTGLFVQTANADIGVTVTNYNTTTPNLLSSYASLASALTALNGLSGMAGPVTFSLAAGTSETTPPTGLTIGSASLNAVLSSINTVTIIKASGTVTLNAGVGTATPGSAAPDGILKIVGADYITIDGLTFTDGNVANPATMEFGVALFKLSLSDGARYNTIQNCTFNMQRINNASGSGPMVDGSVGINVVNSIPTAATTALTPTTAAGTNSYNKFYSNTFNGGNYGIVLSGYAASSPFTAGDTGNDIGGTSSSTGNTILNYGGGAATNPAAGIRANNQWGVNISYNTINNNNGSGVSHATTLRGIYAQAGTSANATITHNDVTVKCGASTSSVYAIDNGIGSTASSNTIDISYNTITGSYTTAASGTFYGIQNTATAATVNMNYNTISGISTPGTGAIYCFYNTGSATYLNYLNNNITTITKTGIASIYGLYVSGSPTVNAQNNTVDGLSCTAASSTGSVYGYYSIGSSAIETVSNNIFRNFSSTGTATFYGIYFYSATGNKKSQSNQLYNFTIAGGGTMYGLSMGYGSIDTLSNNQIHDFTITGSTSGTIYGLRITAGTTNQVYQNTIYALSNAGGTSGAIYGLYIATGTTNNVYRNKVCNISSGSSNPTVYGAYLSSGSTNNFSNNLIGDLRTPAASAAIPLAGIYVGGGTNANVYYNTVYLNATSTGTLFGSAALYASTSTVLDLRNNILVNTSTPVGATGFTAAYRRSSNALANYASTSNTNYYFAGTPSVTMLIFYDGTNSDQTLAAFQARVTPRDNASVTNATGPSFLSTTCGDATFLHINPAVSTVIESGGAAIATYNNDFDGDIRQGSPGYPVQVNGGGSAPDIGGDEFDGIGNFTCVTPAPGNTLSTANNICFGQSITLSLTTPTPGTGVTYQWQSSVDGTPGSYSNILNAVSTTYTTTPTASRYYKCIVTCQNGPVSVASNPIQITFANNITSTTPSSRCGTGTVSLAASGTGTALGWYAASTGGVSLGSGSPWTTPSISTTTTYYVGAESAGPANVSIGTSTSNQNTTTTWPAPYGNYDENGKHHILVLGSELSAAGLGAGYLNSLAFDVASVGASGVHKAFTISIANTTLTALTTNFETTGFTPVFGPVDYQPVAGLNTHTFTPSSFYWNGASNIIVEVCFTNDATSSGSFYTVNAIMNRTTTSFNSVAYKEADNIAQCPLTTGATVSTARPNMVINGTGVCSSPRSAVVATVTSPPGLAISTNQTVCNNAVATITVTPPVTNFDSYTWSPVANLFTDFGCNNAYEALTSATTVYFKSTTAGAYTFTCTANNSLTECSNTATTTVTNLPASPVVTATPASLCVSGSSVLTTVPATGYGTATFQWQSSSDIGGPYGDISGANAISYTTPTLTSTTYYKLQIKLGGNVCTESNIATVTVNNPQVTGIPGSRCGTGTVVLGATGVGTFKWYNVASGGTSIGTGPSFTTPVISATTNYWVEASVGGSGLTSVGPISPTAEGGTIATQTVAWNANFTTLVATTIKSVDIFPLASGQSGVIQVITGSTTGGTVLATINYTTSVSGGSTAQTILIDYNLPTPGSYNLYTSTLPSSGISRNNSGAVYPYTSSVANITGNGYDQTYFMGMYNWKFGFDCLSARQMVTATVTPAPVFTSLSATPSTICEGQNSTLSVTSDDPGYVYVWTPGPLTGTPQIVSPLVTTQYTVTATDGSGCFNTGNVTVTVNPAPSAITITPSAPVINPGDIQPLTASGGIIPDVPLLNENFNGGTNTWTTVNNSTLGTPANAAWTLHADGYIYSSTTYHSNDNSQFYMTNSDAQGSGGITNTELISPLLNTTGYTSLTLKFWHYFKYYGTTTEAKVEVSTDGGTNWNVTPAASYTSTQGTAAAFVQATVDLSAYVGINNLKIRFRYHDTYGWYWCIDNVTITGSANAGFTWAPFTGLYTDAGATPGNEYTGGATPVVYAKPTETKTYTVTGNSLLGCPRTADVTVTVNGNKTLNLSSVFLEGLYRRDEGTPIHTMNQALQIDIDGNAVPKWATGVADTITVELHDSTTMAYHGYETILYKAISIPLHTDGKATVTVPSAYNSAYYVTVKQRNHLETTSALPVVFTGLSSVGYAFDAQDKAYGNNMGLMIDGTAVIFAGDENQDGAVEGFDLSDIGNAVDAFLNGYIKEDIDSNAGMDGYDLAPTGNNADAFVSVLLP